ncbi:MAG: HigA family addiction module antidote protein [Burkholderiaceae bacterium]|jgi:addiction module HigA family antidote|nr:HigA family addiction module antidote protein [Burkholderiaceae bacterium]
MLMQHNPPHPALKIRDDVLPALGLTVSEAARQLGVTRAAFSRVINARAAISPEMALRLQAWLGVERGGRAGLWLAEQAAYDLWQARRTDAIAGALRRVRRAPEPPMAQEAGTARG